MRFFGFRLLGDSDAQSVMGAIELELCISDFDEHEAPGDLDSMQIRIQSGWAGAGFAGPHQPWRDAAAPGGWTTL